MDTHLHHRRDAVLLVHPDVYTDTFSTHTHTHTQCTNACSPLTDTQTCRHVLTHTKDIHGHVRRYTPPQTHTYPRRPCHANSGIFVYSCFCTVPCPNSFQGRSMARASRMPALSLGLCGHPSVPAPAWLVPPFNGVFSLQLWPCPPRAHCWAGGRVGMSQDRVGHSWGWVGTPGDVLMRGQAEFGAQGSAGGWNVLCSLEGSQTGCAS